jgi:hypothetical protein
MTMTGSARKSETRGQYPDSRRSLGEGWIKIPMFGGMVTNKARQLIEFGRASLVRNLRGEHPGYRPRGGSKKLHATAVGSQTMSLFQFSKGKVEEKHFLAQFADGTIREAGSDPPAVGAGAFGNTLFSGSANPTPAAWAVIDDILIYATGADLPYFWVGDEARPDAFVVYRGDGGGIAAVPDAGSDFSVEVTDDDSSTSASCGGLGTSASDHCLMVCLPVARLKSLRFEMSTANAAAASVSIQKYNGAWVSAGSVTDTTTSSSATLGTDGSWSLAAAVTDAIACYQHGRCGYWFRCFMSAQLSATVNIAEVWFSADPSPLEIVWDAWMVPAVECQLYRAADGVYYRYDYATVDLSSMVTGDKLFAAFPNPVEAIYLDTGDSPNTGTDAAAIDKAGRWDGDSWNEAAALDDGTDGVSRPGWVAVGRPAAVDQPRQFQSNQWRAYWYYLYFTQPFSDNVLVSVYGQPFFNVADFGTRALCVAGWKRRALYVFDRFPQYIYVAALGKPMTLTGNDSNFLDPGDGRANAVRAIVCFHNEILVLQEERGTLGGCTTLYQGKDAATFGKRILSTRIGTWSAKSICVVEGVYISTATDERVATVTYWLSWHGVVRCDGKGVMDAISDRVADRFDPMKPATCVRRGYEHLCGIFYDRSCHVLRIWLVCGTSATVPNWFGVYDLVDGSWYDDTQASCYTAMCEVGAASGAVAVIQVAGDSAGVIRQLNVGDDDDGADISGRIDIEFDAGGSWLTLQDLKVRLRAEAGATIAVSVARDGRTEASKYTLTADIDPKVAGEETVTITRRVEASAAHLTVSVSGDGPAMNLHNVAVRGTFEEER